MTMASIARQGTIGAWGQVKASNLRFTPCEPNMWREVVPRDWLGEIEQPPSAADEDIEAGRVHEFTSLEDMFESLAEPSEQDRSEQA